MLAQHMAFATLSLVFAALIIGCSTQSDPTAIATREAGAVEDAPGGGDAEGAQTLPGSRSAESAAVRAYQVASEFVAYVETPLSSGSGIRISKDRLITNAHVVAPFESARIVFGGVEEIERAEVIGLDLLHDLALIRLPDAFDVRRPRAIQDTDPDPSSGVARDPSSGVARDPSSGVARDPSAGDGPGPDPGLAPDSDSSPSRGNGTSDVVSMTAKVAQVADPSGLPVGSEVFLVGFPGEIETHPVAAISAGVLSRHRRWDRTGVGLVQTDAEISGGQSGGALVDSDGTVVGLSSMFFSDDGFAIALSMPDVLRLAADIESGELGFDPGRRSDQLAFRQPGEEPGLTIDIGEIVREGTVLVRPRFGEPIQMEIRVDESGGAAWAEVLDPFGALVDRWETPAGEFAFDFSFEAVGESDHSVVIGMEGVGLAELTSSAPVAALPDPDDGRLLERGRSIVAAIDVPGERDYFELELDAGESVEIIVDALSFATYLTVEALGDPERPPRVGDYWPGNTLGLGSVVSVEAARAGRYRVTVGDFEDASAGAYVIEVR